MKNKISKNHKTKQKAVSVQGIPFEVAREVPNAVTTKAIADSENGNDAYGAFDSMDVLMEELKKPQT